MVAAMNWMQITPTAQTATDGDAWPRYRATVKVLGNRPEPRHKLPWRWAVKDGTLTVAQGMAGTEAAAKALAEAAYAAMVADMEAR